LAGNIYIIAQQKFFLYPKQILCPKLLLILHLLLAERKVRVAAGDAPNSFGKMGGNQWAALCAAHNSVSEKLLSSVLVSLFYQARTYFQNR